MSFIGVVGYVGRMKRPLKVHHEILFIEEEESVQSLTTLYVSMSDVQNNNSIYNLLEEVAQLKLQVAEPGRDGTEFIIPRILNDNQLEIHGCLQQLCDVAAVPATELPITWRISGNPLLMPGNDTLNYESLRAENSRLNAQVASL